MSKVLRATTALVRDDEDDRLDVKLRKMEERFVKNRVERFAMQLGATLIAEPSLQKLKLDDTILELLLHREDADLQPHRADVAQVAIDNGILTIIRGEMREDGWHYTYSINPVEKYSTKARDYAKAR